MKISFVIPVYNEADSLQKLYSEIVNEINDYDYEIIFVDDGSSDSSFQVLSAISAEDEKVRVIRFRRNFGKSAALQNGFEAAQGDLVFTIDSDLQDNPAEIPNFVSKINEGYDLVSGWKNKRKDNIFRKLASYIYNFVTSILFGFRLHDFNCGFKLYRRELVKELDIYGELHRYIPVLARSRGFRITEIPVSHRARPHGKSKFGSERYFRGFFDLLTVRLITYYINSPLYLFGGIGSIFTLSGTIVGAYLSVLKIFYGLPLSNRPLLFMSILLIMIGLQFFSIGLIGELIINQTRSSNKKESVSIAETIN